MKKSDLTSLLTAATLFLSVGLLHATAEGNEKRSAKDRLSPEQREEMMKRADLNGDGQLDDSERAALAEKRREKMSQNPRFLKRADTDQDGQISDAEWEAAKAKFKKAVHSKKRHGDKKREEARQRPSGDKAQRRAYLLGKYDANGDLKLDESERATLRAAMEAKHRENMQKMLTRLNKVDADQDGMISDSEWDAAKASFKQEHRGPRGGPDGPRGPQR